MTTPLGVPNLPLGALTVETLAEKLQDQTQGAMRARARERMPSIFDSSTGGDIIEDLSPFGIIASIWSGVNSLIATADPEDIQGPEDIPGLLLDFIEGLPVIGQFVALLEALVGTYDGDDPTLLALQELLSPIVQFLIWLFELFEDLIEAVLMPVFEFLKWLWELFTDAFDGDLIDTILKPILEFGKVLWETLGEPVLNAIKDLLDFISGLITFSDLQGFIDQIVSFLGSFLSGQAFTDIFKVIVTFFHGMTDGPGTVADFISAFIAKLPLIGPLVAAITGKTEADGLPMDLSTLRTYFRGLENQTSNEVGGLTTSARRSANRVSVSQLSHEEQSLLSQGDFLTSSTVDPGGGWSWDPTQALMVTCTASSQRIYCRQDIKVTEGDVLVFSGNVQTSGFTSGSMQLSIVPWAVVSTVMTEQTNVNGTARTTASAGAYAALPDLTYTVAAGVTSVQVSVVVNCNAGAEVLFDDLELKRSGINQTTVDTLAQSLGTTPTAGSGAKMSRKNTATKITAATGEGKFNSSFYVAAGGGSGVDRVSSDITAAYTTGRYTVTYAGWYYVEIGFTTNASTPAFGAFNVAPAVYVQGTLYKIGADALGSFGGGFGNYARSAHSSFIIYLEANQYVEAGYYNYSASNASFFEGDTNGVSTFFSIAMLNRTEEG